MYDEEIYKKLLAVVAEAGLSVEDSYREIVNGFSSWFLVYAYRDSVRSEISKKPLSEIL
jgi:hypothetical protein